ncbi:MULTISPECIES: hypothetical protein [Sorangium]|uniref:Uncharacterized protein n=1 Tax=Sorangium cellulosum TaxID=56 RepID=A0A4P2QIR9_SORCE|nr:MULTISPECIES: hypothetical protein [Sorangium]AUX29844.1 uncharacterized protein SOCE836_019370 [Sorangium cellulosum]WCQ89232.1 hypothetical protein NQZ70_01919 [Sorangium sp. Soce836]
MRSAAPRPSDALGQRCRRDIIQSNAQLGNVLREAARRCPRSHGYDGPGATPDEVVEAIRQELGTC